MADIMVVFDFDKTIMDWECDDWIVHEFGLIDLVNELLPTTPWNSLMDKMMGQLHSRGKTIADIADVLKRATMHPRIVPAIKSIHALGCELRILSDANLFYIETILNHLGIRECFSQITTNPSFVDEEKGRLRILPFHDFRSSPHGCGLCPPNLCKGAVIERVQASVSAEGKKKRFIYVGDGVGDYCPSLKLSEGDFMMPRKDYPAWDLICQNPALLKAEIHEWTDGEELERVVLRLIDAIITEEEIKSGRSISSDREMQNIADHRCACP
ncbi:inorganic pyrophosphatase 2 [Eucalyptus grandis]|uniref:inorganic pyrophosphatase 2 n=1 Tax=Eucalyptus grandis TaxID=71139 RepID=UPI00192EA174|nr:inorganic pyrophosphatase 2 [Eucalyptus grandis]XP_010062598.2 inorganic pyrophosphatase 2 [Eucalyptus grandis]